MQPLTILKYWFLSVVRLGVIIAGLCLLGARLSAAPAAAQAVKAPTPVDKYIVLAWNDLGMHCYNRDFKDLAVLPPFNTLWAQVIRLGNPPRDIGAITAGGSTSIGAGVGIALLAFGGTSTNDRAILLLTDGLQNTPPMIEEIEGSLGATQLNVTGFGSDADIDGPLLSRVARQHRGQFTRAVDGLALRKFFGLSFEHIFESGALGDPEFLLRAGRSESDPHKFSVCGEERITPILGWDDPSAPLRAHIRTPSGQLISER